MPTAKSNMALGMNQGARKAEQRASVERREEARQQRRIAAGEQERTVYVDAQTSQRRREPLPDAEDTFRCTRCGALHNLAKGNFFRSESKLYFENWGYVHICNSCVNAHYKELVISLGSETEAIRRICQILDVPFHVELARDATKEETEKAPFEKYIAKRNGLTQYRRWRTYADTIRDSLEGIARDDPDRKVSPEQLARWSDGFSPDDCVVLDTIYHQYKERCATWDVVQEAQVITACIASLQGKRMAAKGDGSGAKHFSMIHDNALKAAGLVFTDAEKERTEETAAFGKWLQEIERFCPADIYKDLAMHVNDGLDDYFDRHIRRPTENWLTGTQEVDPEYSIAGNADE